MNKKCPVCGSNHIMKKGKRNGKQRFQSGDCQASFTIKNIGVKRENQFIWFKKRISGTWDGHKFLSEAVKKRFTKVVIQKFSTYQKTG